MTSAMSRTASGRWRATNMMSTAPTNGAHVMIDSTGNGITRSPQAPLGQHEEQQDAERHPVDVVLRQPGLQPASRSPARSVHALSTLSTPSTR